MVNCSMTDLAWNQATLPVAKGGLGIRSVVALAPFAYLASAATTHDLETRLLLSYINDSERDRAFNL